MNLESLKPISKAIAAAIASGIVAFLIKQNIVIADGLPDALEIVISSAILFSAVYFAPKNKETK